MTDVSGPPGALGRRPGARQLLARQTRHELLALLRTPVATFFAVAFPLIFLILIMALVGNPTLDERAGVRLAQFAVPTFGVFGVVMATFSALAIGLTEARSKRVLKRFAGTPLPRWAMLGGRIGAAAVLSLVAVAVLLLVGVIFYDLHMVWPKLPAAIVTLIVGVASFTSLGLAVAAYAPSTQAATALTTGLVVVLGFISDMFAVGGDLPDWLDRLGWIFPLKHFANAFSDTMNPYLPGSGFYLDHLLVMAVWGVLGAMIAIRGLSIEPVSRAAGAGPRWTRRAAPVARPAGVSPVARMDGPSGLARMEGPSGLARMEGPSALARMEGPSALARMEGPSGLARMEGARRAARMERPSRVGRMTHAKPTRAAAPGRMFLAQVRHSNQSLWRDPGSVFFAVAFPVLLVLLVPQLFGGDAKLPDGTSVVQFYAPAMAVYGAAVTAYINMPEAVASARQRGVLKRLRGTPLPVSYFLSGRIVSAIWVAVLTLVAVLGAGILLYGVTLPGLRLLAVLVTFVLSVVCFSVCGLAVVGLVRSAQSFTAVGLATLLPLSFISDIFILGTDFPTWLDAISWVFPLRHAVHGVADPFGVGAAGSGFDASHLAVIAGWLLVAAVVAPKTFGWDPRVRRPNR